jgi:hypothetical protein
MADSSRFPKCFGPYLQYAISTSFKDFEFFDEKAGFRLFLLVELRKAGEQTTFVSALNNELSGDREPPRDHPGSPGDPVVIGLVNDDVPFVTLRASTRAVTPIESGDRVFCLWDRFVCRVELSLPMKLVQAPPPVRSRTRNQRWEAGKSKSLLVGIMDDGCPFAAAQFLGAAGTGTRVQGIWDQNRGRDLVRVNGVPFGHASLDFAFGSEYGRDSTSTEIGLDHWIALHQTSVGSIDEDGCYADAGFTRLASQRSHGAHVMDVLAGNLPLSSRIAQVNPSAGHFDPPSWKAGVPNEDPACGANVVFVQFADDCICDATGVWLKAYILDGIRYIMSFAEPNVTRNVIINLSYGPTTGPHDGTAELEVAISQLVTYYDGSAGKPRLDIFLAAGNSYLAEEHVQFTGGNQDEEAQWIWRLPPDNTARCFAEIWTNDIGGADNISVSLTSPSGHVRLKSANNAVDTAPPAPDGTEARLIGPVVWRSNKMWLLEVGPTVCGPGLVNEHGDWTIRISGLGAGLRIDAYVARTDPNMGVSTGARRSFFVDPVWEQNRAAAASCIFVGGEFDHAGSLVSRFGTLNGIATGNDSAVHVAGGYILLDKQKSSYSSAGPSRRYPESPRAGPDYLLPCDESEALPGILAGGTRSGSVFRLIGTSNAAPELARLFIKHIGADLPDPSEVPTTPAEQAKAGGGDLPAP